MSTPHVPSPLDGALPVLEKVALHAFTWLLVGNVVGVWLSTLLLVPTLGTLSAPLTYGRIMPVHLDLQLYGWCALPLVALLMRHFLPRRSESRAPYLFAQVSIGAWSAVLAFGAVAWLAGETSGKVFLEWSGPARVAWSLQLVLLAAALGFGLTRRSDEDSRLGRALRWLLLAGLLAVPVGLYTASGPAGSHPPINPETGGTTGTSVFGATLGTAILFCALPLLLGAKRRSGDGVPRQTVIFFALASVFFSLLDHGDVSRSDPSQMVAILSLALFPLVVIRFLRHYEWSPACRRWLLASGAWGGLLVASGILTYLPGVLQRWKFTNALVGHAHLAMAGLLTGLSMVILAGVTDSSAPGRSGLGRLLDEPRPFWLWQGGCGLLVTALLVLGTVEAFDPEVVFRSGPLADSLYGLRLLGGLAMTAASAWWWRGSFALAARRPAAAAGVAAVAAASPAGHRWSLEGR